MITVETLKQAGANVGEGLGRCLNNEQFYLSLVNMALGDANFEKLAEAVDAGDKTAAFEAAHALKGVLGNLSLTPIFDPVSEATELLRAGADADYRAYVEKILAERDRIKAL